jgi:transposase
MMAKKYEVRLSEAERAQLRTLVGCGTAAARTLTHARILLKADRGAGGPGWTDQAIAAALEVGLATVARVRQAYATTGLEAALHQKRPDREYARTFDGEREARLLALACSEPPRGREHWSLRLLAEQLVRLEVVAAVSHETVRRALQHTSSSRT